jgi:hypothetical protein
MLCWNVRTMYTSIIFEDTNSTEQGYIRADEKYLLVENCFQELCFLIWKLRFFVVVVSHVLLLTVHRVLLECVLHRLTVIGSNVIGLRF